MTEALDIFPLLKETTTMFRKGEEVIDKVVLGVQVREIFAMPHESEAPEELDMFDLHFIKVGVKPREAEELVNVNRLLSWLTAYPQPDRLAGGPSYIEIGAVIGDQDAALCLFALGAHLKLWKIITPETLHLEGEDADMAAGRGLVMISGWKAE